MEHWEIIMKEHKTKLEYEDEKTAESDEFVNEHGLYSHLVLNKETGVIKKISFINSDGDTEEEKLRKTNRRIK